MTKLKLNWEMSSKRMFRMIHFVLQEIENRKNKHFGVQNVRTENCTTVGFWKELPNTLPKLVQAKNFNDFGRQKIPHLVEPQ